MTIGKKTAGNAMTSVSSSLIKAVLVASAVDLSYYTDDSCEQIITFVNEPLIITSNAKKIK